MVSTWTPTPYFQKRKPSNGHKEALADATAFKIPEPRREPTAQPTPWKRTKSPCTAKSLQGGRKYLLILLARNGMTVAALTAQCDNQHNVKTGGYNVHAKVNKNQ
jgi:hypothetical protein